MTARKPRRCSYRTIQVNHNSEAWLITQDIRRQRNPRTGERYLGKLTPRLIKLRAKQMGATCIIRLKRWKLKPFMRATS